MFEFMYAKHRDTYIRMAFKHYISPRRVWQLAHGSQAKTNKEKLVQHELLDLGIIHRSAHKHRHHSEEKVVVSDGPATTPAFPDQYAKGEAQRAQQAD